MKSNKIFKLLLLTAFVFTLTPFSAIAAEQNNNIPTETNQSISARAESTGYIYKEMGGIMYKRLWSYTRGCWIDPTWTPC